MECKKCGSHMKVTISRHNKTDNETYRKLKCSGCGNTFYTCECEVDYESIEVASFLGPAKRGELE